MEHTNPKKQCNFVSAFQHKAMYKVFTKKETK